MTSSDERRLTVMLVPEGGRETRTYEVSYRRIRVLGALFSVAALALTIMAGSWWYLAARAARAGDLQREVEVMTRDRARVTALVQRLESIEEQYGTIRTMFGQAQTDQPSGVWLPPIEPTQRAGRDAGRPPIGETPPSYWPLAERGFITQELFGGSGDHPGLDIAVASDAYIRAAGGGSVVDVGEDAVYGRFVVLDHGGGYTTLYGHASTTLVALGQAIRERQVIALSGSTGRSTGPHLHFEVLLEGEPVDPLTMVQPPG